MTVGELMQLLMRLDHTAEVVVRTMGVSEIHGAQLVRDLGGDETVRIHLTLGPDIQRGGLYPSVLDDRLARANERIVDAVERMLPKREEWEADGGEDPDR